MNNLMYLFIICTSRATKLQENEMKTKAYKMIFVFQLAEVPLREQNYIFHQFKLVNNTKTFLLGYTEQIYLQPFTLKSL